MMKIELSPTVYDELVNAIERQADEEDFSEDFPKSLTDFVDYSEVNGTSKIWLIDELENMIHKCEYNIHYYKNAAYSAEKAYLSTLKQNLKILQEVGV